MIEQALYETQSKTTPGWIGTTNRKLYLELWSDRIKGLMDTENELLTKLHGSVNWEKGTNREILIGTSEFIGNHDRHLIIYPGYKETPDDTSIYHQFHEYFKKSLKSVDIVIFIGFAFRDEHINEICERNIEEKTNIFVIDPSPINENIFINKQASHINKPFNLDSISDLFKMIDK